MTIRSYKYRIYLTRKQRNLLNQTLEECRWLYNHFLEQRKTLWEEKKQSISMYDQTALIPELKKTRPSLEVVYSQCLQDIPYKLELAFNGYFRRVKLIKQGVENIEPGYPRFKGVNRYSSLRYPQMGGFQLTNNKLRLGKIGCVKIKLHRPLKGTPKTCVIKRTATGKWFASISCECTKEPLYQNNTSVGIDVGIKHFATLSDGTKIENPKFFKQSEQRLAKAQRRKEQCVKGTLKREKAKMVIAHVHERTKNQRSDFAHKLSRTLVNNYGTIAIEDIHTNQLISKNNLNVFNKAQQDVAWSQFFGYLVYKAEEAGRLVIKVNPAYTSQDCSSCGTRKLVPLEQRTYHCDRCGLELDRDYNAALNILRLGTQSLVVRNNNLEKTLRVSA